MKVEFKDGNVIITAPVNQALPLSSTLKTKLVASSGGFKRLDTQFRGAPISVNLVVCVPSNAELKAA